MGIVELLKELARESPPSTPVDRPAPRLPNPTPKIEAPLLSFDELLALTGRVSFFQRVVWDSRTSAPSRSEVRCGACNRSLGPWSQAGRALCGRCLLKVLSWKIN